MFLFPFITQVSQILRRSESVIKLSSGEEVNWSADEDAAAGSYSVTSVDSNQLDSNSPIEDKLAAARCLHTTGNHCFQSSLFLCILCLFLALFINP